MTTRVFVGNLAFSTSEQSIRDAFARFGDVQEVHLPSDRETGRPRGFAFVTMGQPSQAREAIASLDGQMLEGRPLRVNEAEARPDNRGGGGGGGGRGGYGGGGGGYGGGGGGGYGGGGGGGGRGGRGGYR